MRLSTAPALLGAALALAAACRKPTYDPAQEKREAEAFVAQVNELARSGGWGELSALFSPDPKCTTGQCVARTLARGSACEPAVQGSGAVEFRAGELFPHGDGFSAEVALVGSSPPCRFQVDVSRRNGTGPFELPGNP